MLTCYKKITFPILAVTTLLPLLLNIEAITYNCFNAWDFTIYQQAIYDILTLKEWNPYLTIRSINIFNDHFEPILYSGVLFTALFGQGFHQLLIFEWAFFIGLILSVCYIFRFNFLTSTPYIFCILTTPFLLDSFLYPIHPSTWSCLPLFWLTYFIVKDKTKGILGLVFLTCLFKESFAFALFPLGIFYIVKKEFKTGVTTTLITSVFILHELYLREYFLGPTIKYGHKAFEYFISNPLINFSYPITTNFDVIFKKFYPFIFCFFFFLKKTHNKTSIFFQKIFPILLILLPLFSLHMKFKLIDLHYGAQFAGILIGLMVSLDVFRYISKKQKIIVLSLFVLSSLNIYYSQYVNKLLLSNYDDKCILESDKLKNNRMIRSHISRMPSSAKILASGGVTPYIMIPNNRIMAGLDSRKRCQKDM